MGGPGSPNGEVVQRLPRGPVHLWQLNNEGGLHANPMGCGAFSTAMTISVYQPDAFANGAGYKIAQTIYDSMLKVPFSGGGTFELQNSMVARARGLSASMFLFGTFDHLAAAIDLGAPVIALIERSILNFGKHDVVVVGYSRDAQGRPLNVFIDNPWLKEDTLQAPDGSSYPGNSRIAAADLPTVWTSTYTPVFGEPASFDAWRQRTGSNWGIG